jgi:hypothetical protein
LDANFEAILSGRILFTGADGGNGRDFSWGMFKRVDNGAPNPTGAWLGYLAQGGSGDTPGRLLVRNPDSPMFSTASFVSVSIATTSGPAPPAGPGSQINDYINVGMGPGTYFLLAETPVTNNAIFDPNRWHTFEIRAGRFGDELSVRASLIADPQPPVGDYNDNGTVDAADYTVWRDNLGGPGTALQHRDPDNIGEIGSDDYDSWKANFGATSATPYELRIDGGVDSDDRFPPALDEEGFPVAVTPHLTFDFDRVGFLFGDQMNADQVQLKDVDISTSPIETIELLVDTTTGNVQIRNNLATPFEIDYYEITSELGVLEFDNWESLDAADGGLPVTNDYLAGWDVAEGSSDFVLSEGNFVGFATVAMSSPIDLGDVFKSATAIGDRDIRFFVGVAGGSVMRGTVIYTDPGAGSAGIAAPEPTGIALLATAVLALRVGNRCKRLR